jgi:hypothetical protein
VDIHDPFSGVRCLQPKYSLNPSLQIEVSGPRLPIRIRLDRMGAGIDYWCVDDQRAPEDLGQVPCRRSLKFVNFLLLYELGIFADEIEENKILNTRTAG